MKKIILLCCICIPILGFAQTRDTVAVNDSKEEVLTFAEFMPIFPGGNDSMYFFLSRNIEYPSRLKEYRIEGKIIISFIVKKDGNLEDIKVINKTEKEFMEEGVRVVKLMPKWNPGKEKGEFVNVRYILPIHFYLD